MERKIPVINIAMPGTYQWHISHKVASRLLREIRERRAAKEQNHADHQPVGTEREHRPVQR